MKKKKGEKYDLGIEPGALSQYYIRRETNTKREEKKKIRRIEKLVIFSNVYFTNFFIFRSFFSESRIHFVTAVEIYRAANI